MRFIILTQYYLPETGAPQNRLSSLAENIQQLGYPISIITAMPNYPKMKIFDGYKNKLYLNETINNITVRRVWLFTKYSSSKFIRLLNYLSFCFTSIFGCLIHVKKNDILICESPPLFLGVTAVFISRIKRAKLVFNVSDLWPESVEKVGLLTNRKALKILYKLEKWIYDCSHLLTGQTQGIVAELSKHKSPKKIFWLKNGVDYSFIQGLEIQKKWREENKFSENDFLIVYGGVIGFAQALHTILESADMLKGYHQIKFILVGDGPEKERLVEMKNDLSLSNVFFMPNTSREKMLSIISASSVSIVPLKKINHFLGAIPSKIFEALAFKKPILLGVDGEAKELFIDGGNCGLYFEPENVKELTEKILLLYNDPHLTKQLGENGEQYVKKNFDRKKIAFDFTEFCKQLFK
jgi:glycosyltransferase involved in cell wall biosynthesis